MSIKGLDAHICGDNCDPANEKETHPDPTHWHVSRHRDDEDVFITPDIYSALDYAATELRERAEFEWEGIAPSGEAGDYQTAYESWKRSEDLANLAQTAHHAVTQYNLPDVDGDDTSAFHEPGTVRAPLYRGYGGDAKIMETAKRAVEAVNMGSPLGIWECSSELVYLNDNGTAESDEDNGFPYHLDDWEPGYQGRFTRGPEPAAMTDR
jgi:hypothetical protein